MITSQSVDLVEMIAQYEPVVSAQFLALYQSARRCDEFLDLIRLVQLDVLQSQLSSLIKQRDNLLERVSTCLAFTISSAHISVVLGLHYHLIFPQFLHFNYYFNIELLLVYRIFH